MSSLFRWQGLWKLRQPRLYCICSGAFLLPAGASGSPYLPHPEEEGLPLYNWGRGRWGAGERGRWRERSRKRRWECFAEIWLTLDCIYWPCFLKWMKKIKLPPRRMAFIMHFLWFLFDFIFLWTIPFREEIVKSFDKDLKMTIGAGAIYFFFINWFWSLMVCIWKWSKISVVYKQWIKMKIKT